MNLHDTSSGKLTLEYAVQLEDGASTHSIYSQCNKNPGHKHFIPVSDLTLHKLPPPFRNRSTLRRIHNLCDRTVKVSASFVSPSRPDKFYQSKATYPFTTTNFRPTTRCGTGFLSSSPIRLVERAPCPCPHCRQPGTQPEYKYWTIGVRTATHIVFNEEEAAHVLVECFFDSQDDKSGVKCLYGIRLSPRGDHFTRYVEDKCELECCTHDPLLAERLSRVVTAHRNDNYSRSTQPIVGKERELAGFMISHPHGLSKTISFGSVLYFNCPVGQACDTLLPYHMLGRLAQCRLPRVQKSKPSAYTKETRSSALIDTKDTNQQGERLRKRQMGRQFVLKLFTLSKFKFRGMYNTGKPTSLPSDMTLDLPPEVDYFYRCDAGSTDGWVNFPPGTKVKFCNGVSISFPPETEFYFSGLGDFYVKSSKFFLTYDIPSCPGCSGALIGLADDRGLLPYWPYFTHTGGLTDGTNRSGLSYMIGSTKTQRAYCNQNDIVT